MFLRWYGKLSGKIQLDLWRGLTFSFCGQGWRIYALDNLEVPQHITQLSLQV